MNSRFTHEQSCHGKHKYYSWRDARAACRLLRDRNQGICHPYRCLYCKKIHVGHTRLRRKVF